MNTFICGSDYRTEWMIPWFIRNYKQWNTAPLIFFDFGVRNKDYLRMFDNVIKLNKIDKNTTWFMKPKAMLESPGDKTVWIDIDCEVLGSIESLFDLIVPNKLLMGEDVPWSWRSGRKWFNSGVVGFEGKPQVLKDWAYKCKVDPVTGDQETLHIMIGDDALNILRYIEEMPRKYNVLRLDHIDGSVPPNPLIHHWTGYKGKEVIKKQMMEYVS